MPAKAIQAVAPRDSDQRRAARPRSGRTCGARVVARYAHASAMGDGKCEPPASAFPDIRL